MEMEILGEQGSNVDWSICKNKWTFNLDNLMSLVLELVKFKWASESPTQNIRQAGPRMQTPDPTSLKRKSKNII